MFHEVVSKNSALDFINLNLKIYSVYFETQTETIYAKSFSKSDNFKLLNTYTYTVSL